MNTIKIIYTIYVEKKKEETKRERELERDERKQEQRRVFKIKKGIERNMNKKRERGRCKSRPNL